MDNGTAAAKIMQGFMASNMVTARTYVTAYRFLAGHGNAGLGSNEVLQEVAELVAVAGPLPGEPLTMSDLKSPVSDGPVCALLCAVTRRCL